MNCSKTSSEGNVVESSRKGTTYRGMVRSSHISPKSETTYSNIATTAKTNEAVSRTLRLLVNTVDIAFPQIRTTTTQPFRGRILVSLHTTRDDVLTKDLVPTESFPLF